MVAHLSDTRKGGTTWVMSECECCGGLGCLGCPFCQGRGGAVGDGPGRVANGTWVGMQTMAYGGAPDPQIPWIPREHVPYTLPLSDRTAPDLRWPVEETPWAFYARQLHELFARTVKAARWVNVHDVRTGELVVAYNALAYNAPAMLNASSVFERLVAEGKRLYVVCVFGERDGANNAELGHVVVDLLPQGRSPFTPKPGSPAPPEPESGVGSKLEPELPRKLCVAARLDPYGQMHLRISIDGVHLREVAVDGDSVSVIEDI